jgi:hypothetical protein
MTMTKTLLSRGGISGPTHTFGVASNTNDIVDLLDDQRVGLEKLKMRGGDSAAKKKFGRLIKEKNRMEQRSMDMGDWEAHLPRYARHKISAPKVAPETYGEMVLRQLANGGGKMLEGDQCYLPAHDKVRCDLCNLYFSKESTTGVISMNSILELQKSKGVKHNSKKFEKASFLYSKSKVSRKGGRRRKGEELQRFNERDLYRLPFVYISRHSQPLTVLSSASSAPSCLITGPAWLESSVKFTSTSTSKPRATATP